MKVTGIDAFPALGGRTARGCPKLAELDMTGCGFVPIFDVGDCVEVKVLVKEVMSVIRSRPDHIRFPEAQGQSWAI